jgi:hypothetical protein
MPHHVIKGNAITINTILFKLIYLIKRIIKKGFKI